MNLEKNSGSMERILLIFAVKCLIVLFISTLFLTITLQSLPINRVERLLSQTNIQLEKIREILGGEWKRENQIRLLGALSENPRAHWLIAQIHEGNGKIDKAIVELELGIGMLELHSARPEILEEYRSYLRRLQLKQRESSRGGKQ